MRGYPAQLGSGFGPTAGSIPTAPVVSLATGTNQVTVTIDSDASVTNYLKYKSSAHSSWQDGGSRSGDGDITVTSLSNNTPYIFIVYSMSAGGLFSTPGVAVTATLTAAGTASDFETDLIDGTADFLSEFGEDVKYLPRGGGEREITAVVDREAVAEFAGSGQGQSLIIVVIVANSATTGIATSEVDTGGDKIELAMRLGETVKQRRITKIIGQDAGMLTLEVR